MTFRVKSDITCPLYVVLQLLVSWLPTVMLMHVNLLLFLLFGTIDPIPCPQSLNCNLQKKINPEKIQRGTFCGLQYYVLTVT